MFGWIWKYIKSHYKPTRPEGLMPEEYLILAGYRKPKESRLQDDSRQIQKGSPRDLSDMELTPARSIRGFLDRGVHFRYTIDDRQLSRWWRRLKRKLKRERE